MLMLPPRFMPTSSSPIFRTYSPYSPHFIVPDHLHYIYLLILDYFLFSRPTLNHGFSS